MISNNLWLPPPQNTVLQDNVIHVWRARLDALVDRAEELQRTLTEDELSRAERFRFQKDRVRFVLARSILRNILGRYLDMEPHRIQFSYGRYGKPALSHLRGHQASDLSFNLSHSDGLALYAVSADRAVGIDIERVRADFKYDGLADTFFSPGERAAFQSFAGEAKRQAFFSLWTRKEAYLKATGSGLSFSPDRIDVISIPSRPSLVLDHTARLQAIAGWSICDIVPQNGYVASLAAEGQDWRPSLWRWCG